MKMMKRKYIVPVTKVFTISKDEICENMVINVSGLADDDYGQDARGGVWQWDDDDDQIGD